MAGSVSPTVIAPSRLEFARASVRIAEKPGAAKSRCAPMAAGATSAIRAACNGVTEKSSRSITSTPNLKPSATSPRRFGSRWKFAVRAKVDHLRREQMFDDNRSFTKDIETGQAQRRRENR